MHKENYIYTSKSFSLMPELSINQSNSKSGKSDSKWDYTLLKSMYNFPGILSKFNSNKPNTFNSPSQCDHTNLLDMYKNSLSYMIQELATTWTNSPGDPLFLHHLYRIQIANSISDLDPYISLFGPCFEDPSSLVFLSQYIISKLNALFLYDTRNQRLTSLNINYIKSEYDCNSILRTNETDYVDSEYNLQDPILLGLYRCNKQSNSDDCAESGFNCRMSNLSTCDEGPTTMIQSFQILKNKGDSKSKIHTTTTTTSLDVQYEMGQNSIYTSCDRKKRIIKSMDKNLKCQNEILMLSDYAQPMKGVSFNAKKQAWLAYWTCANNFQMRKFPIKKYGFRNAKQMAIQCRLEAERQNTSERIERFREKLALRTGNSHSLSPTLDMKSH